MAKAKSTNTPSTREEVLDKTLDDIRGKFGQGSIMRLGENPPKVEAVPTGILPLDVALGCGGFPRGRIVELYGPEGSGKTTVALYAIAEMQKAGETAAFIDAEHALDPRLAATLGVNIESLYLSQPDSGEQALYILDALVRSGAVGIVVVDSVAALTPQAEIDGRIGESQMGLQARLMSYALRRLTSIISKTNCIVIFVNQLRALISTGYGAGPTETTAGGRALKFYSTIRLEVRRGKKIEKGDTTIGHELYMKVVKNKVAPPFRSAHTSLIYGKGIPKTIALVDMAIDQQIIKKKGSWLAYKGETLGQGRDTVAQLLEKNIELQQELNEEVLRKSQEGLGFNFVPVKGDSDSDFDTDSEITPTAKVEEGILELDTEA
jgi:recombination protein RecA